MSVNSTSVEVVGQPSALRLEEHYCAIAGQLLNALIAAAPASSSAAGRLKSFKAGLNQPSQIFLQGFRNALGQILSELQQEISRFREQPANGLVPDPATGLPGASAAQQVISNRLLEGKQTFAAVLVLDQLRALNARFGRAVGDGVLGLAAEDLAREFKDSGVLYRWRGPAFVVICTKGKTQADALASQIRALVIRRLEQTINVENRSIHLKITFSWVLKELGAEESPDVIVRELDDFVAAHSGEALPGR